MPEKMCYALLGGLLFTLSTIAAAAKSPDTILIGDGNTVVTQDDFERLVGARIPEDKRIAALSRPGAVREMIAQLYIIRSLAREAEQAAGIDQAMIAWQTDVQRDRLLMEALVKLRVAESVAKTDWEALARDYYKAKPDEFSEPERVRASHILIGTKDREKDAARVLAEDILGRAQAGEDFASLAEAFSEDPSAAGNKGDLGFFDREKMVPAFASAAFALEQPGDLAGPVETPFGYHIIRLTSRQETKLRPFEQVSQAIITDLKKTHAKEVRAEQISRVRAGEDIEVNQAAVGELEQEFRLDIGKTVLEQEQRDAGGK